MRKWLLAVLLFPASLAAADFSASVLDFSDPAKALSKSTMPVTLAASFLDAGEDAAVEAFAAQLPERQAVLANKISCLLAFYRGNLAGAVQALENVDKPDPWVDAEKKYLQDLMTLQAGFTESRSDHFSILLPKTDAFLAQYALPALEGAYEKASSFYGVSLSTPVRVEIYPDAASLGKAAFVAEESFERTGLLCVVKFRRVMLLSPRTVPGGYRWLDALASGYQRLLITQVSGGMAPVWLKEGLARRGEAAWRLDGAYEPTPADANRLAEAALVNPTTGSMLLPFARMEPSLRSLRNQEDVLLSLVEAADAVDFLLKEQGPQKVLAALSAFRRHPREEALARAFGVSEQELEASWVKSLEGRPWSLSVGALDRRISFKDQEPAPRPEAAVFLQAGDAFRNRKQWASALVQYRKALALEPENGALLFRAAKAAQSSEDLKTAEASLRHAMAKNPSYVPPFVALGQILYDDGRYDEAQKVLQEGLEIQPFHPRLHETLGFISMDVGDAAAARLSFQRSLDLDPQNPDLRDVLSKMPKPR